MLIIAKSVRELNFGLLMGIYEESNRENALERWPELPEGQRMLMAEGDFYQYLREIFFTVPGSVCCIWEENGTYVSALRLEPYRDGVLLEALETAPTLRCRGYGEKLIRAAIERCGGTRIYSHVGKSNEASLAIHKKCGFNRTLEYAVYVDGSVNHRCCTMVFGE